MSLGDLGCAVIHADHLERAADETGCLVAAQAFATRAEAIRRLAPGHLYAAHVVALVRLGMHPEDAANAASKDHPYCPPSRAE